MLITTKEAAVIKSGRRTLLIAALAYWPTPICHVTANWTQLPITEKRWEIPFCACGKSL
jgi:hypothetical protein